MRTDRCVMRWTAVTLLALFLLGGTTACSGQQRSRPKSPSSPNATSTPNETSTPKGPLGY